MLKRLLLIAIAVVLSVLAFSIAYAALRPDPVAKIAMPVGQYIPDADSALEHGWNTENLFVSGTEALEERSLDVLQLDDYVHRRYTKGNREFTVYIVYWKPGRTPPRFANLHNPKNCWVVTGAQCTVDERRVNYEVGNIRFPSGDYGEFLIGGQPRDVYFWHLMNGVPFDTFSSGILQRLPVIFIEPFRHGLNLMGEQLFIRIETGSGFASVEGDPFYISVIEDVFDLMLVSGLNTDTYK